MFSAKVGVSEKHQRSFPWQIETVDLKIDQIPGANSVAVIYGCELACTQAKRTSMPYICANPSDPPSEQSDGSTEGSASHHESQ